jgi:multidrug efflux system outer membrane protein
MMPNNHVTIERKIGMKKLNIIMIALASVVFTGCKSLYGKYERPDVNTKGIVRDAVSATDTLVVKDTTSFGNLPWRSVFTDPQLQSLIQQGLNNNPNLLNAALNVQMAEAQLKAAKLAFVPQFTFTPQGTIASWDGNKASKVYSLPVNASWSVDLFGNLLSQKRSSQMALLATKDYQLVVKTQIISNIANMYYTLLMLDSELKVLNDMESLTKETWDKMKIQHDLSRGVRSTAVQSAEANYYSVQTQKTDIQRQIRETENSLSLILGQPAQTIARSTLESQSLPTNLSTGIGIQMLSNRPDVHYSEMSLAECFYNIETARSRFYPSLTINGSGAYTNSSGAGIVNPGKILLSAVGSLVQPIFMKGQLTAGLKVAKAQYEQAYNTWQNSVFKAGSEVSNALVLYNSSEEKSKIEAQRMKVLQKNVMDTKDLMAGSTSTYLEVITAQQLLLNSELSKIGDDFSKMQAVVNLYYALGGGSK